MPALNIQSKGRLEHKKRLTENLKRGLTKETISLRIFLQNYIDKVKNLWYNLY